MTRSWIRAALAGLVALVVFALYVSPARAEERRVVVLMARDAPHAPWPEATQAVIAELAARGYQVIVESSPAKELGTLLDELRTAAQRPATVAAVAVVRDGTAGVAYVWTVRDANVVQVTADTSEGAVAEGALALRVTELVRARELPASPEPEPVERKAVPAPTSREPAPPTSPPAPEKTPLLLWLGGGPTFAAGADSPLVAASLGVRVPLGVPQLGLDAGAAISVTPLRLSTTAGAVEIAARQATLHLMFDPWSSTTLNFALGAGVGAVWLDEKANAEGGYQAHSDETVVAVASIRARGAVQSGNVSFVLALEPGLLLPAASIHADGEELARIGRPWTTITAGFGWLIR